MVCASEKFEEKVIAHDEKFLEQNKTFKEKMRMGHSTHKSGLYGSNKRASMGARIKTVPWRVVKAQLYARFGKAVK